MKVMRGLRVACVVLVLACAAHLPAQWASMASDAHAAERIAWWREARFGMFIHWGVYSIPGRGEWVQWNEQIPESEYAKLAGEFNPQHYDPAAWAALAKDGGASRPGGRVCEGSARGGAASGALLLAS